MDGIRQAASDRTPFAASDAFEFAVTIVGVPLGLAAVKFWTRKKFKGTAALKKKISPPRIPIEKKESVRWLENLKQSTQLLDRPGRCIHIGDRESDIYELFCAAQEIGTHFDQDLRRPLGWRR
jgi:hypothetical protein